MILGRYTAVNDRADQYQKLRWNRIQGNWIYRQGHHNRSMGGRAGVICVWKFSLNLTSVDGKWPRSSNLNSPTSRGTLTATLIPDCIVFNNAFHLVWNLEVNWKKKGYLKSSGFTVIANIRSNLSSTLSHIRDKPRVLVAELYSITALFVTVFIQSFTMHWAI